MNRDNLIKQLVDRKIVASNNGKAKNFCICMARKLCFAGVKPTASADQKR